MASVENRTPNSLGPCFGVYKYKLEYKLESRIEGPGKIQVVSFEAGYSTANGEPQQMETVRQEEHSQLKMQAVFANRFTAAFNNSIKFK